MTFVISFRIFESGFTVGELKDLTLHKVYGVKLPKLQALWAGLTSMPNKYIQVLGSRCANSWKIPIKWR